jgi:hypothetical protein
MTRVVKSNATQTEEPRGSERRAREVGTEGREIHPLAVEKEHP